MTDDPIPNPPTPPTDVEAIEWARLRPRERLEAFLSGLGFYRLSKRRQRQLRYALVGSAAAFALALAIFGGWVVMHTREEKQTIFETPPPVRTYEPRQLEHKVKLKKQQRSSSRPSMLPRVVALKMTALALPEIKLDPKLIHTTFQPKFKAVSGKGLGAGLGTGYGEWGFGDGVSSINFFGIHARGEKTAILLDVSVSMIEPERGGPEGYQRVRQRIEEVIDALNEATMFNVICFADAASWFEDKMVIASKENKTRAKLWVRPFNTPGNYGLDQGNVRLSGVGLKACGGTTRLDLALTAAFELGADTILILSDGLPRTKKCWSAEQLAAFRQQQAAWHEKHAAEIAAWEAEAAAAPVRVERVWVPPQPARPPSTAPLREGQPIDRGSPAVPGHWREVRVGGIGRPRPAPPPIPDPGFWTLTDFIEHLRILHEHFYAKKGQKPPVLHCIGYMIDKEGHEFLQALARHFKGEYRRVARLK